MTLLFYFLLSHELISGSLSLSSQRRRTTIEAQDSEDPRWGRQAKRTVGTKPPENPSSENPTTKITPQQRQKPKSPQTQPDIKTQQPQPYTNTNKRNQSTTNQVNGLKSLNKPRAKTRQTLNKSEKPN